MGLCGQQSDNTDLCSAGGVNTYAPNTTTKSKFTSDIQVKFNVFIPIDILKLGEKTPKTINHFHRQQNKRKTEDIRAKLKTRDKCFAT